MGGRAHRQDPPPVHRAARSREHAHERGDHHRDADRRRPHLHARPQRPQHDHAQVRTIYRFFYRLIIILIILFFYH